MPRKTTLRDSVGNPLHEANYVSNKGLVYKITDTPTGFKYVYSGNFEKPYRRLIKKISQTLTPLTGSLELSVMGIFNMLNKHQVQENTCS